MFCGQLQCSAGEEKPYFVDYGTQYQQISLNDKTCRLVALLCVMAPEDFFVFTCRYLIFHFKDNGFIVSFKGKKILGKRDEEFSRKKKKKKDRKEKLF